MKNTTALLLGAASAKAITGTNIGGWMVLEPWITPSLFYRFLGKTHTEGVGMDSYTFCEALGPEEGNRVMRAHWDTWYTEDDIKDLADRGVEMVRLPIGDWTLSQYGPYVGCMDGAEEKIQWMFDTCDKYNIKVLLDVHAHKGSQNGFDNSGQATELRWIDETHFSHWPNSAARWQGSWNIDTQSYDEIDRDNINLSISKAEALLQRWGSHPAFGAFEPINEPWWASDLDELKDFYRKVRPLVQKHAPQAHFVFHDAFHYDSGTWNDLFEDDDVDKVAVDHHFYEAWWETGDTDAFCQGYKDEAGRADDWKYEVWFGEWSLATDVCATWLGGFNDANTDPQHACNWVDCPRSYLPDGVAVDFDRTADILGPFGTHEPTDVCIQKGKCPTDSSYQSDDNIRTIAKCALEAYDEHLNATFFWTAHNEIEERWDYVKSWDLGFINKTTEAKEEVEFIQ